MGAYENNFPAIRCDSDRLFDSVRELYIYEEAPLMDAIRRGDRPGAVHILNHLLVHIYSAGAERSDLLKGLLLELIVMMSRAAVAAGASQTALLGLGFRHLAELAAIDDDEALAGWLRASVLRIFEAVEACPGGPPDRTVTRALEVIRQLAGESPGRDEVARRVGISPSRLGEILRERTGRTFSELVAEARIEMACGMLRETDKPLAQVAAECGFCDQSYFTNAFQKAKGQTPRQYRAARKSQNNPP